MSFNDVAAANFETRIKQNPYPGRGIIIGKSDNATWQIVYWIMGRSTNSRNRRFVANGTDMRTEPVDLSQLTDPSLIIYDAMLELPGLFMVSNGDQTRTIYDTMKMGNGFEDALMTRMHEPDAPNFTPRISGLIDLRKEMPVVTMSILKSSSLSSNVSDRYFFRPQFPVSGFGYGITTYQGDGNPLPSFSGDPVLLPLKGDASEIIDTYWKSLNQDNLVSLAVKTVSSVDKSSHILVRNRHA
ncbi:MAG: IMP cyclohydrolase [Fibrobacterota bacterium]|nr:IMP cyclohydrolase [Chitinispirillaceae bacterium]